MNTTVPAPERPPSSAQLVRRSGVLALSAVIGLALIGFLVGINQGVPRHEAGAPGIETHPPASLDGDVRPAISYAELRQTPMGPTAAWKRSLEEMLQPLGDSDTEISGETVRPDPEAKLASLRQRSETRAYNGAPPVIPHAVDQMSDAACYACHGQGMRIGERVARPMSHGFLSNCTQCHAPPPPAVLSETEPVENEFVGLAAPVAGERAWPGAPPTIPHSTWMRENCLACHGTHGWEGMETTHPWRSACQQCHAPSAHLEQGIVGDPYVRWAQPVGENP
jgi:nitrate reductase (cytochrome), electron transfer subunit